MKGRLYIQTGGYRFLTILLAFLLDTYLLLIVMLIKIGFSKDFIYCT